MRFPKAVLFDLDDTLYDHSASAQAGVGAWRERHAALARVSFEELERSNAEILEAVHLQLLAGELSLDEARALRTRRLFARYGMAIDDREAAEVYSGYRAAYEAARQLVPGCLDVLDALRAIDGLALAVVTNNLVAEQVQKLSFLGLDPYFDEVVISEAVGVTKPDPGIFALALKRLGVQPEDAVMVGDSLPSDVEGAEAVGIRAVWLDRRGEASSEASPQSSPQDGRVVLRGWTPLETALRAISVTE